jgi:hypothetical protein
MAAEFGQPGNFHTTLKISLSTYGTGRRSTNFTIDHNLSCLRGSAESGVVCAWSRDFGMRVDEVIGSFTMSYIQLSHWLTIARTFR